MGIPVGISREAATAMSLQWQLKMRRGWTMSRHGFPQESYAGILGRAGLPDRVAALMKTEFQNLLELESRRHHSDDANELWKAMPFATAPAIRLIWEFFSRAYFRQLHYAHRSHTARYRSSTATANRMANVAIVAAASSIHPNGQRHGECSDCGCGLLAFWYGCGLLAYIRRVRCVAMCIMELLTGQARGQVATYCVDIC